MSEILENEIKEDIEFDDLPDELKSAMASVYMFMDSARKYKDETFLAAVCMIIEEYSHINDYNVVDIANGIAKTIKEVNEESGKYKSSFEYLDNE